MAEEIKVIEKEAKKIIIQKLREKLEAVEVFGENDTLNRYVI